MEYRPLGQTGVSVSALSYGAAPLGGVYGEIDEADGIRCVHHALDLGINLIDVSPYYGETRAETVLGLALRGIDRDRYLLCTKVGRYGNQSFDFSAERVTRSVNESLARLGLHHVDILLCHDIEYGSLNQIVEETLPALQAVVSAGKARFLGVSGLPLAIYPLVLDRIGLDVILSYCHHTLTDTSLDTLMPYLNQRKVGVLNAAPLGMGLLSPAPPPWHPAPSALRDAVARAAEHCRSRGVDLADLAISWSVNARADVATTIVGSASAEQIERNVRAADATPDSTLLAEVRAILRPVRDLTWPSGRPENDPEANRA